VEALHPAGFTWLFNSSAWWDFEAPYLLEQYELYRRFAPSIGFPESHDTDRLRNELEAKGVIEGKHVEAVYRARYLFAAVFSTGVMMPVGYEYGYRKRLHVVETRPSDREEPHFDLSRFIAEAHEMKASVPALNEEGPQEMVPLAGGDNSLTCLLRRSNDDSSWVLTVINSDLHERHEAALDALDVDVMAGAEVTPGHQSARLGKGNRVAVNPGAVRVFAGGAQY
jgi:starch synthase (maltosyl-transferring)